MTTRRLIRLAALAALTAAAHGDLEEVEQRDDESDAMYAARLTHYGATLLDGK